MLEAFGTVTAAGMVACYALEERGAGFSLGFAVCCLAAAVYAFAIGSWPFFVLELLWSGIAAHRGIQRLASTSTRRTT